MKTVRILSTKKLLPQQKHLLLNAGMAVVEADYIEINYLSPEIPECNDNLIFTSQNAVRSIRANKQFTKANHKPCFCVGSKTKSMLEAAGFTVAVCEDDASELAEQIVQHHRHQSFTFFSGNLRQGTLPERLLKENIQFNEIGVYRTVLKSICMRSPADGILFFSPSAVDSFLLTNTITDQTCFCIGATTAQALAGITQNVVVAKKPTIENVIVQTIKFYTNSKS